MINGKAQVHWLSKTGINTFSFYMFLYVQFRKSCYKIREHLRTCTVIFLLEYENNCDINGYWRIITMSWLCLCKQLKCFSHPESVQQNLKHDYLEHLYIFNSKNIEKNDCDLWYSHLIAHRFLYYKIISFAVSSSQRLCHLCYFPFEALLISIFRKLKFTNV